jgi:hypothetical protein
MRIATTGARWLPVLAGLQLASAKHFGVSQDKLDRSLDDKLGHLPGPIRWLVKKTQIVTGKEVNGEIPTADLGQFVPALVVMRYFSSSSKTAPIWYQALQKNQLLGPLAQALSSQNQSAHPIPEGFKPGQRWWALEKLVLPAFPLASLEEYMNQESLPPEERSVLRNIARTVVGVPLQMVQDRSFPQKESERLYDEGILKRIVDESTGQFHYEVKGEYENTAEGQYAQAMLNFSKLPASAAQALRRMYHQQQRALEAAGVRNE